MGCLNEPPAQRHENKNDCNETVFFFLLIDGIVILHKKNFLSLKTKNTIFVFMIIFYR